MPASDARQGLTGRAAAIRDAARELLEEEGPDGLSMRPLAERVGAHPPAVYRHFPDKRAVERAVAEEAFWQLGDVLGAALAQDAGGDGLAAVAAAYRRWAHEHPHLFRLVYGRPTDPLLDEDAERHSGAAIRTVARGDVTVARAMWAACHGLVILELDGRFPAGSDLDAIWAFVLDALRAQLARSPAVAS